MSGGHVLVVDDDDDVREAIAEELAHVPGYAALPAMTYATLNATSWCERTSSS